MLVSLSVVTSNLSLRLLHKDAGNMKQLLESLAALHLFPRVTFTSQTNGQRYKKETDVVHSLKTVLLNNLQLLINQSYCWSVHELHNFPDIRRASEAPKVWSSKASLHCCLHQIKNSAVSMSDAYLDTSSHASTKVAANLFMKSF